MTTKTIRELSILGVLLLVLGGVLYRNQFAGTAIVPPAPSNSTAAARAKRPPPSEGTVTDVKLALLDAGPDTFAPPQRNPFRFKPKPAPDVRPVVQALPPPAPLPRPAQAEPGIERFVRYVGYMVSGSGVRVAALQYTPADGPAVPLVGSEGYIIEGRYRLLKVEPDTIEVVELAGQGRRARISRSRS
ncbi:MAG TPA: hypothetical protein VFV95_06180 [Vicinamibacterales bacterium]|nr:hypothetical protein [Vicinamibacterales bacterium]